MKRIVHFEIPSRDLVRTVEFYKKIFSWEISKWAWPEEYWSVVTWPKTEAWIDWWIEKNDMKWGYVCIVDVPDIEEYSDKIISAWWTLFKTKREIMPGSWLAYFKDTDWNVFWIIQTSENM
ncbi:MAG: hypothetical protein ACD_2C00228G0003 [uncultured bacterium (gcode 4)]|uniref:VOC domain-containing protein n=1 Tax=uncultured bacterium (gcode 4) TaxID=1234023 RepID=K2H018_9BACT|nr:MAG: hypothetical protein ACD_2C00228G0003 [uncultured bacterium (gcode 4)]